MRNSALIPLIWLGLLAPLYAEGIQIDVPGNAVRDGAEATITITRSGAPLAGAKVKATYNPKSEMEDTVDVGTTDASGQVKWLPTQTGIAQISVNDGEATKNTVVLFRGFPLKGLIIFLFAGTALYGGIILAFLRMRREWGVIGHVEENENEQ